jgi:hypothetical protein
MSEAMIDRTRPIFAVEDQPAEERGPVRIPARRTYAKSVWLNGRDEQLLAWVGEQYTVRADLLAVLMARLSSDPQTVARGRVAGRVARRRIQAWRQAGLVCSEIFLAGSPATVWLTGDGYRFARLPWRTYEPSAATTAHRHAVGLVRAEAETVPGLRWVCERDLREGAAGRPSHLPDGVVEGDDGTGGLWRSAVEVELSRKTEARVKTILGQLLARYDDVVYHATPAAAAVVTRAAAQVTDGERVSVRRYPPAGLADLA